MVRQATSNAPTAGTNSVDKALADAAVTVARARAVADDSALRHPANGHAATGATASSQAVEAMLKDLRISSGPAVAGGTAASPDPPAAAGATDEAPPAGTQRGGARKPRSGRKRSVKGNGGGGARRGGSDSDSDEGEDHDAGNVCEEAAAFCAEALAALRREARWSEAGLAELNHAFAGIVQAGALMSESHSHLDIVAVVSPTKPSRLHCIACCLVDCCSRDSSPQGLLIKPVPQSQTPSPADAALRVDVLQRLNDLIRHDVLGFRGLFLKPYGAHVGLQPPEVACCGLMKS